MDGDFVSILAERGNVCRPERAKVVVDSMRNTERQCRVSNLYFRDPQEMTSARVEYRSAGKKGAGKVEEVISRACPPIHSQPSLGIFSANS